MTNPLDCPFHLASLQAFLEQAAKEQNWPDPEATRRLAYAKYEQELAGKNAGR